MFYSALIAAAVPFLFLYLVKWLNFFETHRPRLIWVALVWGAIAFVLSYLLDHPLVPIFGRPYVGTHIGPAVEEIFKSMILLYLVRRSDYTYWVDGAIYGFAVGVGFAVAENMLYLSRVDADTALIVAIARAFSASVLHGGTTAIVGMAIGGFPLKYPLHPLLMLLVGWAIAIAYHMSYNTLAYIPMGQIGMVVMCVAGFGAPLLVVALILWGLRRERKRLRRSLAGTAGLSKGEASLVRRMDDLDDLLAPVEARWGEAKRDQVAQVLVLTAQLAMKRDQLRAAQDDPELRDELGPQIVEAEKALKRQRHLVGLYVMSYVRAIVPRTAWSLWVAVEQAMTKTVPGKTSVWQAVEARLHDARPSGASVYDYALTALAARAPAPAAVPAASAFPDLRRRSWGGS